MSSEFVRIVRWQIESYRWEAWHRHEDDHWVPCLVYAEKDEQKAREALARYREQGHRVRFVRTETFARAIERRVRNNTPDSIRTVTDT